MHGDADRHCAGGNHPSCLEKKTKDRLWWKKSDVSAFTLGYLIHFWPHHTEKYPLLTFYQVKHQYLEFVFDKRWLTPPPLFATALSPLYPVLPLAHNIVTHVVIVLLKDGITVRLCCWDSGIRVYCKSLWMWRVEKWLGMQAEDSRWGALNLQADLQVSVKQVCWLRGLQQGDCEQGVSL